MEKLINNGGPAFPFYYEQGKLPDGRWNQTGDFQQGMTLRQWYAGMAIQGMQANCTDEYVHQKFEVLAQWAFQQADAMITHEQNELKG